VKIIDYEKAGFAADLGKPAQNQDFLGVRDFVVPSLIAGKKPGEVKVLQEYLKRKFLERLDKKPANEAVPPKARGKNYGEKLKERIRRNRWQQAMLVRHGWA
jgi:hypothetical protein